MPVTCALTFAAFTPKAAPLLPMPLPLVRSSVLAVRVAEAPDKAPCAAESVMLPPLPALTVPALRLPAVAVRLMARPLPPATTEPAVMPVLLVAVMSPSLVASVAALSVPVLVTLRSPAPLRVASMLPTVVVRRVSPPAAPLASTRLLPLTCRSRAAAPLPLVRMSVLPLKRTAPVVEIAVVGSSRVPPASKDRLPLASVMPALTSRSPAVLM